MWKYHLKCLVTNGTLNFGLSEMCGGIGQAEGDLHQIFDQSKSLVWNYYQQKIKNVGQVSSSWLYSRG